MPDSARGSQQWNICNNGKHKGYRLAPSKSLVSILLDTKFKFSGFNSTQLDNSMFIHYLQGLNLFKGKILQKKDN